MYKFEERTETPTQSNATDKIYFFSSNNGYWYYGYGMPNCTAYALGEAMFLGALNGLDIPYYGLNAGVFHNADSWGDTGEVGGEWERGSEPKLGAIAVWRGGGQGGHVAIVEAINDNGTIKTSNSGWHGSENVGNESDSRWWWIQDNLDVNNYGNYTFRYFLYPPYIDEEPTPPDPPEPPEPPKDKKSWIPLAICKAMLNNL